MSYLAEALHTLKQRNQASPARQGKEFERMVCRALRSHTGEYGAHRFKRVMLWNDWEHRDGPDHGIDIVAEQTDGGLCAVQCKFYANEIPAKEVNSFLAASEGRFSARIFVVTADFTKQARQHIESASPRCEVLSVVDMDDWVDDWRVWIDQPDRLQVSLPRHTPRPDQQEALAAVADGFAGHDKGKLIWPCGTGKSLLAMWSADRIVGVGGTVLYLVPSISLMGQTMREWARHSTIAHSYLGVCSDKTTGRRDDDTGESITGLAMPVSTDVGSLAEALEQPHGNKMRVVFSTYQSSHIVADALLKSGQKFDLAVCDEAHRTTGLAAVDTNSISQQSAFTLIHDNSSVVADRRLFMTATPRVYTDSAKKRARQAAESSGYGWDVDSYSMDDETVYGPVFHEMTFSEAIDQGLLSDYQIVVIAAAEAPDVDHIVQADEQGIKHVSEEEAVKLLGCWDALSDPYTVDPEERAGRRTGLVASDGRWAKSAIVFTNKVDTSKRLAAGWWDIARRHRSLSLPAEQYLQLQVDHIDGKTSAFERATKLNSLKTLNQDNTDPACRILTNARVLTEGVDVPALDAVIFFEPRTSKIDITQAVGRVMRTSPGKQIGRVVVPVVVPEGKQLSDDEVINGTGFKVVIDVIKALRSHDQRIDYWVNHPKTALNKIGGDPNSKDGDDHDRIVIVGTGSGSAQPTGEQLRLAFSHVRQAVASKLVESCGDRKSWINWGQQAAAISATVHNRLLSALNETSEAQTEFAAFVEWMRTTINPSIDEDQAAEMVAQHIVTIPIFDHMFTESRFADLNPVSQAVQKLLHTVDPDGNRFEVELKPLQRAYRSMQRTFDGALTAAEKVDVLRQVYDGFFAAAMKKAVDRLGLVYTPVEIVDFILRSADAVCRKEFGKGLGEEGVNILDPFTGTGTFIYRLLTGTNSNGEPFISDRDLERKYRQELHANEMVLLAYYIAALKIEAGYAERKPQAAYQEFPGIVLADSFLLSDEQRQEQLENMKSGYENSERGLNQATTQIKVIVSNPPWSSGQDSASDDNPNIDYEEIAKRIQETYGAKHKQITGKPPGGNAVGNLYIHAIRWASDRIDKEEGGIVGFVHPNSLATGTSLAGARYALRDEYTDIYVINLRGNAYTSGKEFRKEGDKIFGQGSRNGVQITFLVYNPNKQSATPTKLLYSQVADYCTLKDKFNYLREIGDVTNTAKFEDVPLTDAHHWVNLTDGTFEHLLPVCDTDKTKNDVIMSNHALGIATALDIYVYAYSRAELVEQASLLVDTFNEALIDIESGFKTFDEATANNDLGNIKWTGRLKQSLKTAVRAGELLEFDESCIREVLYRPFVKKWLYEDYRILSAGKTVSAMFPPEPDNHTTPPQLHRFRTSSRQHLRCCRRHKNRRPQNSRNRCGMPVRPATPTKPRVATFA